MSKELKQMLTTLLLTICLSTGTTVVTNQVSDAVQAQQIAVIEKRLDSVNTSVVVKDIEYLKMANITQDRVIEKISAKTHLIELSQTRILTVMENLTKAIEKLNKSQDSFKDALIKFKREDK